MKKFYNYLMSVTLIYKIALNSAKTAGSEKEFGISNQKRPK